MPWKASDVRIGRWGSLVIRQSWVQAPRKLILYNLTDVVNMVELVETTVRLKQPQLAFPGEIMAREPQAAMKFNTGCLGKWIIETLSSWNLA